MVLKGCQSGAKVVQNSLSPLSLAKCVYNGWKWSMVRTLPGKLFLFGIFPIFRYIPVYSGTVPWSVPSLVSFQIWYIPYIPLYSGIFRAVLIGFGGVEYRGL